MIVKSEVTGLKTIEHNADLCVVGGGMAGMLAAISAARHGAKVAIMQDRPVFGGNASSEVRMWIRGAHGKDNRETGLLEEIALLNIFRNPTMNFSIWDSVLFEKVKENANIEVILNCSCCDAKMSGNEIVSVKGWQTTTQSWHEVTAKIFADCSGDSILAPLTGAEHRIGRESCDEFGEDIAPKVGDNCTMGLSCLFQVRETEKPSAFKAPEWANKYTKESFPYRIDFENPKKWTTDNYWWIEIGGVYDSIADTEKLRDELLKITFGVWDFIKNSGTLDSANWELEWLGFLPGKRESRRYAGDYMMTQNDVRSEGRFEDLIAYGGWSMDDHHPMGFLTSEKPTIFHPAPSPFGIAYRSLYSKNIDNLMFAGRNISATHSAMSSSRVMATCAVIGQAMGTAASIAVKNGLMPRGVYEHRLTELQQTLMEDDCYLPFHKRVLSPLMEKAKISSSSGDASKLFDGNDRNKDELLYEGEHAWSGELNSEIIVDLGSNSNVSMFQLILDSDLNRQSWAGQKWYKRDFPMRCNISLDDTPLEMPFTLLKEFDIFTQKETGSWELLFEAKENHKRLVRINIPFTAQKIKVIPKTTWGAKEARIYSIYFK